MGGGVCSPMVLTKLEYSGEYAQIGSPVGAPSLASPPIASVCGSAPGVPAATADPKEHSVIFSVGPQRDQRSRSGHIAVLKY
eukprot:8395652-Pyramimonas_sp.AAC.1